MTALVLRGDTRRLPLADASVDLVVTSPPYFALRSYTDGGEHYAGQIGSEATPAEYIAALVACTREWVRVLKPSGSIFVNLGDSYSRTGSLLDLPHRYSTAVVDSLGVIKRAEIIWAKPHVYGDKAKDRVRRTHEVWHHLTVSRRYHVETAELIELPPTDYTGRPQYQRALELFTAAGFSDSHLAAVRSVGVIDSPGGRARSGGQWGTEAGRLAAEVQAHLRSYYRELCTNLDGRPPCSVWEVATEGVKTTSRAVGHFAAFPVYWPYRLIKCWTPAGGTVVDPFGGTGTTAHVAAALGRTGISVDLSMDYCRLAAAPELRQARRRKVLGLDKPDLVPVSVGQGSLFTGEPA